MAWPRPAPPRAPCSRRSPRRWRCASSSPRRPRRDAVALALALAAKILAGTLAVEPERVLDTVRGALRRVTDRRRVTVLVDPADLETVSAAIAELEAQVGGIDHCDIQADRRVGRGGAIVRTLESEVDASVDTQLERAREVIQAELGARSPREPRTASGTIARRRDLP